MTLGELRSLARLVGFDQSAADIAAAIAMAESSGDPRALGDGGNSYGLWQVHIPSHPEYAADPSRLYDPETNARAAYAISGRGTNWKPWSTYNHGSYLAWMPPVARGDV